MTGGAILILIVMARLVAASGLASGRRATGGEPPPPSPFSPRARTILRLLVVWLVALPICGYVAFAPPRMLVTYMPGSIFLLSILWWPFVRYVVVPLGLVRPAYYMRLLGWTSGDDRVGLALLEASLAAHRSGALDPEDAAWVEERIQKQTLIRSGTIASAASMAAARGDHDGARALFESVYTLLPSLRGGASETATNEWLAADAAARGAWEDVLMRGIYFTWSGRAAWLLSGVAMRVLGRPGAPGRYGLLLRWLIAPRRLRTFAIVERALSVPDGSVPFDDDETDGAVPVPEAAQGDLLGRALAEHVRVLSAKKPKGADIAAVGRAFDAAFDDDALADKIAARGSELGAARAETALVRMRRDVEESLFHLLKSHRVTLDDTAYEIGDVAGRAARRLRDETLAVIEALSDAVRSRVNERRALPSIDEWREWTALRIAYERGVELGGPEVRYLAFTKVHSDVCALAVWLFNERKERPIANAMFRFLLAEATAVGDNAAIELQTKNVACGV